MILIALASATLIASAPCADLPWVDHALDAAAKAPETWPDQQRALAVRFSPVPLTAPEDADTPQQIAFARSRIHGLCALEATAAPGFTAPDRARLTAILSRPEFAQARSKNRELIQEWLETVWSWLSDLLQSRGAGRFAEGTRALVLGLAIALIVIAAWRVLRMKRGKKAATRPGFAPAPLRLDPPQDHLRRARAALEGDPREAIREALLALLSALERRRLARPDRVKTNGEIVAELPSRGAPPELIERVSPLIAWYDRTFYSLAPVNAKEAGTFVESVAQLGATLEGRA